MSLPSRWIDHLFAKLTVAYGQDFLRRWEGIPMDDVKADWADELSGFAQQPEAIKFGLANLPSDKPPNAKQFRDLCRRAPEKISPMLPPPPVDSERLAGELTRLAGISGNKRGIDHRAWAHKLQIRESQQRKGEAVTVRFGLTKFQREAWREALNVNQETAASAE